ncbi:MAG: hypothetical protein ABIY55_22345 [Kofleriaceae bacterium]
MRTSGAMRARSWLVAVVVAVGCGGAAPAAEPTTPVESPAAPPAPDTRTPLEQRRDAACDQLGPKLTSCAVEDAHANLAAGKIDQAQLERDTAPAIQRKNTEDFAVACKGTVYSSRQIRVLEVCFKNEPSCAPLLDCLGHLSDTPKH